MTDPNPSPTTRMDTPGTGGPQPGEEPAAEPTAEPVGGPVAEAAAEPPAEPTAAAPDSATPPPDAPPPAVEGPPAAAQPNPEPAPTAWGQQPTSWGQQRPGRDPGRWVSVVVGLIVLVVGLWLFAEVTLGLDLPTIRWSQLWPVILIVIGGWIVLGTMRRGSR